MLVNENKIILGTAQFGQKYGISNQLGVLHESEVRNIFNFAIESGINFLDTAIDYKHGQKILKKIDLKNIKVITKLPLLGNNSFPIEFEIENLIKQSMTEIGIKKYYGVLLHNPQQLLRNEKDSIIKGLDIIKKNNYAEKIGISIYSPDEIRYYLEAYPFDIVQCPLNILDQRLLKQNWHQKLKLKGVELHIRSIFLQGLLLMKTRHIPRKFNKWESIFENWHKWLSENNLEAIEACFSFVNQLEDVDKILIGVQSKDELKKIMSIKLKTLQNLPTWPKNIDENLINPYLWGSLN